ncbi:hypothetical protein DTL42_18285 [Bremerella cremea]|uniref:Uncharacterized protein n=1 Tax=Bremerella cremea TaxID=1031537 RepID=A0A368KMV6_9BACT|nr:hypothetical protein [Bremerella cremea]RCS43935.1 hypothetical protein DTL42_18285 [Bremerella cremea]
MVLHPAAASLDCNDCAKWIVDLQTGHTQTVRVGPSRTEVAMARPPGVPTPCASCPKQNPEQARRLKLSRKNEQTYQLWLRARATFGHAIPAHLKHDLLLARNFAELDQLHAAIDLARQQPTFNTRND